MKRLLFAALAAIMLLPLAGCGGKTSEPSLTTSTPDTASGQNVETEASDGVQDNQTNRFTHSEPVFVDGAFQLEEFMGYYGFYNTSGQFFNSDENECYLVFHDGWTGADYITIGRYSWSGNYIHIRDEDFKDRTSYMASSFNKDSGDVPTEYDGLVLSQDAYDALIKFVPTLHDRLVSNECPFAGYGVKHGYQPGDNSGAASAMSDHGD